MSNEPDSDEIRPVIAATGSKVYVAYDIREIDSGEIFFRASTDNGDSFKSKIDLGNFDSVKIAAVGSNVYVTLNDGFNDGNAYISQEVQITELILEVPSRLAVIHRTLELDKYLQLEIMYM